MSIGHLVRRAKAAKRESAIMESLEEAFRAQHARLAKSLQQRVRRHHEKLDALDAIDAGELVREPGFIKDQCDIDIRK